MSPKFRAILKALENSGDSEALAIVDCLRGIAKNGGEQAKDEYLLDCAENIRDEAAYFVSNFRRSRPCIK